MLAPAIVLAAILAAPAAEPEEPPQREQSAVVGAAWCTEKAEDAPGCDVGLGVALVRRHRLAWVAVVGGETLGTGLAWTVNPDREPGRPVIAVAAGVVVRYDGDGIEAEIYPAIGATLSFGRR